MDHFSYRNNELYVEEVAIATIAKQYGTPAYIYSRAALEERYRAYDDALGEHPHLVCYAVKANSNLAVLDVLARLGAGFDIVSIGELERVLRAGGNPARIVFSGVGKQTHEIRRALEVGIRCFNVESEAELERIDAVAGDLGKRAAISLRVNPDVDAKTHPYISTGLKENKFGIDIAYAEEVYSRAAKMAHIDVVGVDCHIGSQLTQLQPFLDAFDRVLSLIDRLAKRGIQIHHLDIGGGLGVTYQEELPPSPQSYVAALLEKLGGRPLELVMEPGRSIVANAGILLTKVEFLKCTAHRNFAIVDAAMNDLLRPSLYGAWQAIEPVAPRTEGTQRQYDLVGPVCETGDFLGKDRSLIIEPGDLLVVRSSGAYGFVMSSNYNSRNRPPEILVDGNHVHVVRRRETLDDQLVLETRLPL
ncbi:diaminopimelate decarboxylase [Mangrovitalea sediminis]|uniref:diaminopimelate decarboxylase n=1 Tax=Mangrovitalea sediminis TaxID=1982043 RepID=UPI000BE539C9|nr:diaminopimelate decarboxylase [Mangrovitalea sediminis]